MLAELDVPILWRPDGNDISAGRRKPAAPKASFANQRSKQFLKRLPFDARSVVDQPAGVAILHGALDDNRVGLDWVLRITPAAGARRLRIICHDCLPRLRLPVHLNIRVDRTAPAVLARCGFPLERKVNLHCGR